MTMRIRPGRLEAAARNSPGSWRRLFCFPHAGAGAVVFAKWPQNLPSDLGLGIPCLPGRDGRIEEPPCAEMPALISILVPEMLQELNTSYALYGHSMGAFIAFDLAHELSKLGYPPAHLFVSAQRAPSLPYPRKPIYALPDREFVDAVMERYANIPLPVLEHKDMMAILLRTLRADFTLTEAYQYRAFGRLTCPITAFGGTQDQHISREQLEAWAGETSNQFRLHWLPGGHFFHQESREELVSLIQSTLDG